MAEGRLPIAPPGLGSAGKALWHRISRAYELSPGQLELLRALAQTEDSGDREDGPESESAIECRETFVKRSSGSLGR